MTVYINKTEIIIKIAMLIVCRFEVVYHNNILIIESSAIFQTFGIILVKSGK